MKYLVIVGTVREGRNTIRVAERVDNRIKEKSHDTTFYDLKDKEIPFLGKRTYKEDEEPVPEDIEELSGAVEEADCIVIVSPEYNHSIPGVLKNALDYLYPEYDDKLFSYVTVSAGGFGGVRALGHLHDITHALGGRIGPDLPVSNVNETLSDTEGEFKSRIDKFISEAEEEL